MRDQQVEPLRAKFHLLRYELPGHGASAALPGPYTIDGLGASVLALLDSLGVDRVAYCGISLGGMIGMWLGAHAPARVSAFGLACTSAYLPPASGWLARAEQVLGSGMAYVAGPVVGRWFTPEFSARSPAVIDAFCTEFEGTGPGGYAGCRAAIAGMDQRSSLAAIKAPTLVAAGAADPATPPEHADLIARGIPGALLDVIDDAAHLALVSNPGRVTVAVMAHLPAAAPL
ncbi:MAG TPA: alpha/beta fold hydrolase [Streptosporangiaceae bacterium]|nr:alpha/beta fold hydrolase [Streptosporangiaceae bacterium]